MASNKNFSKISKGEYKMIKWGTFNEYKNGSLWETYHHQQIEG